MPGPKVLKSFFLESTPLTSRRNSCQRPWSRMQRTH